MRRTTTALTLVALLAIGTQATAQDTTTPPGADALDLGEPVGPRAGEVYVAETHGDWKSAVSAPPKDRMTAAIFTSC
jgi:hypothetical protein